MMANSVEKWLILICFTCFLLNFSSQSDVPGFSSDGSLGLLLKAQQIVETKFPSRDIESTVFAIKYRSAQVMCSITRKCLNESTYLNDDCILPSSVFYRKDDRTLACFVGRRADCLQGRREIIDYVEHYEQNTGNTISALRLALALADLAHEQNIQFPMRMPLAYNCLIIGSHSILQTKLNETIKDNDNSTDSRNSNCNSNSTNVYIPNLFRIDVSGNFYRCDATSAGNMAIKIKNWIQTKGRSLLLNITEIDNNSDDTVCNTENNINHDILVALGLVYNCLVDNYLDDLENRTSAKNDSTNRNNSRMNTYTNIELAFNYDHYHNNNVMGPFTLAKDIFLLKKNADTYHENDTDSINHRGFKIWTFLKQSKFI